VILSFYFWACNYGHLGWMWPLMPQWWHVGGLLLVRDFLIGFAAAITSPPIRLGNSGWRVGFVSTQLTCQHISAKPKPDPINNRVGTYNPNTTQWTRLLNESCQPDMTRFVWKDFLNAGLWFFEAVLILIRNIQYMSQ